MGRLSQVTQSGETATKSAEAQLADVSDAALVERLTRGDRDALAALYQRHGATLLALAYRLLRDRQESEDLIHDVFLEAWQHCAEYSQARSSVRGWLLLRTRSRALDRLRARARRRDASTGTENIESGQAHEYSMPSDEHRLPGALAQMPVTQKDVLVLSYFEGLSTLEISSRLGIPTGTVKSRTHAAIATLRHVLGVADD
jgi:RNA polymerase sigma-70 factor (ECF subfamily)